MNAVYEDARLLAARGHTRDALAALDAVLGEEPDHVAALLLKASLLLETREGEAALDLHERATRLAPESAEAWNGLARCLHALARDQEALSAAERARGLLPVGDNFRQASPVYLTLVWCLRELRRYKEALAAAEEGLERCPDAILAQWAGVVEEELAEAEKEEC
ncbi:MAG TPA: tetratricopeptide repeat protein [Vicinamibacteria bacterium]|nr:tetratricopeptide repeat protein [Vicinamibacteria bacterium]